MSELLLWYVAHTRPRCEKKLAGFCEREGFPATLPMYRTIHKYRGKKVAFDKPLFPGYLFLRLLSPQRLKVYHSNHLANLLDVHDQPTFERQLNDILLALESGLEIRVAPEIRPGTRVRIKSGPLRGMEAFVDERFGPTTVVLRLDFIGKGAAVKLEAEQLEPC